MSARSTRTAPAPSLGRLAARGAAVSIAGQAAKAVLQLVGIVVLARLLLPQHFGLVAMVTAVVAIATLVRDLGLSAAAIRARSLTHEQRSNLFWINAAMGLALSLLVVAAAPLIAALYDEPRLTAVAQAIAVTFFVNGLATQLRVDLVRRLKLGSVMAADVLAMGLGLAVAVGCAASGLGYWSLVAQQVSTSAVALVALWAASRWVPGRPRRDAPMAELLRFGWGLFGVQALTYLFRNVDSMVIGARFGSEPLGFYNRAYQLLNLPLVQLSAPATNVAVPILTRAQDDPERYRGLLVRSQVIMAHALVAVFAVGCALAEPLVLLVLGSRWSPVVPLFQILAVGGVMQALGQVAYWCFLVSGRVSSAFRLTVVTRGLICIPLLVVGSSWGLAGVAWGYTAGQVLTWPISLWWADRAAGAPGRVLLVTGLRTVVAYGLSGAVTYVCVQALPTMPSVAQVPAGLVVMAGCVTAVAAGWPAFRRDVLTVLRSRSLLAGRGSAGP